MAKVSNINVDLEDKKTFVDYCDKKKIHQMKLMKVLISVMSDKSSPFGSMEIDWGKVNEYYPKTAQEDHIFEVVDRMLETSGSIDFWSVYTHIQETLGLVYSQAQINFVIEDYFCRGDLWIDPDTGLIHLGSGKRFKKRFGKGDVVRWKSDWVGFCGTENVRDMRIRLGTGD